MTDAIEPKNFQAAPDALKDKIILITGAGDGIGRAAALSFAKHGATIVLLGKTINKLEAVYDEILAAGGPEPAIYPMHLGGAVEKDFDDLANTLEQEFGRLDGLLHNASILGERKPIAQTNIEKWNEVMQINVTAMLMLTKATMLLLEAAPAGSIVMTSSGVGRKGRAYWGAYAVSKFATEGLMQVLADELANTSTVRVNTINPGATNTAMRRNAYPGENPEDNPMPEAIMAAYLYLMSDESLAVNGQALNTR